MLNNYTFYFRRRATRKITFTLNHEKIQISMPKSKRKHLERITWNGAILIHDGKLVYENLGDIEEIDGVSFDLINLYKPTVISFDSISLEQFLQHYNIDVDYIKNLSEPDE